MNAITKQQTPAEQLGIPDQTYNSLSPLQQGWLQMSEVKRRLFEQLQNDELAIQSELSGIDEISAVVENQTLQSMQINLQAVQTKIKDAASVYDTSKAHRLQFTNMIDEKLIQPAMAFEKRSLVLVDGAKQKELSLRLIVNKKENEGRDKEKELNALKAHIESEHFRIASRYRFDLNKILNESYIVALQQKQTKAQLPKYKKSIEQFLRDVKLSDFERFPRILVNDTEAMDAYNSIKKYADGTNESDAFKDLQTAINSIEEKFSMYDHDLKQAALAIESNRNELKQLEQTTNQEIQQDVATNNLRAQATTITTTGGAKTKVKEKFEVVYENNTGWMINVLANFMKYFEHCNQHVKVKEINKLTVDQMAKALGSYATDFELKSNFFQGLNLIKTQK